MVIAENETFYHFGAGNNAAINLRLCHSLVRFVHHAAIFPNYNLILHPSNNSNAILGIAFKDFLL